MGFLGKYRKEIFLSSGLIILYFILRITHILSLPIFTDEAIYVRWAQIAKNDASWRFISLTDGKQPLFIWLTAIMMKFIHDPLLAGRLVSVVAGFFTMIGVFFVGKELFKNKWIGFLSSFLYVLCPITLVYDRMALYDSLVATFYIWSIYFGVLLVKKLRLDLAFILGVVLGGGALNKSIGLYSIYLLPLNLLLFPYRQKNNAINFLKWILYVAISSIIAEGMYQILRLSPWFYIIKQKDSVFFYPLSDLVHKPLMFWINNFQGNLHGLFAWLVPYLTWPLLILVLLSFVFYKEFLKEKILIFLYFVIPFSGFAVIAKVMYPRYILFMSIPLLILGAYSLLKMYEKIKNRLIAFIITLAAVGLMIYADCFIVANFAKAPIPEADLFQYIQGWPSGGGVKEAINFLEIQAQRGHIYISTAGTFGLMPYSLEMYLVENPNITIKSFWPVQTSPPADVLQNAKKMPTFVLFYQPCPNCQGTGLAPLAWPLTNVFQYNKGNGNYLTIYKVNSLL